MKKIKTGDEVIVVSGKDKGRRGTVLALSKGNKMIIEGINMGKKTARPNPNKGETGGIVDKEMPIDISNVMLFNPATGKADRVGFKRLKDNKKVRYFKSNDEVIDA